MGGGGGGGGGGGEGGNFSVMGQQLFYLVKPEAKTLDWILLCVHFRSWRSEDINPTTP